MRINVKTKNYDVTHDVQEYLDERLASLEKLIGEHADDEVICDIELEKALAQEHGNIWRGEINLELRGDLLRAEARRESMNAAIDELKDEITKQLRRNKGKRTDIFRRSGAKLKEWLRFGGSGN